MTKKGQIRRHIKATSARGGMTVPWTQQLQVHLMQELERFYKAGVTFSAALIQIIALELIKVAADELYASHRITSERGRRPYEEVITIR